MVCSRFKTLIYNIGKNQLAWYTSNTKPMQPLTIRPHLFQQDRIIFLDSEVGSSFPTLSRDLSTDMDNLSLSKSLIMNAPEAESTIDSISNYTFLTKIN